MSASYLIISTSLNPSSRSRLLAKAVEAGLIEQTKEAKAAVEFVDLRDVQLPLCDGGAAYGHPNVATMTAKVQAATCIIIAVPIYNYNVNAACKNLVELTGKAWEGKIVGFLCAAGGKASYMSVMGFANGLMLDFRCLILPRFVYADRNEFLPDNAYSAEIGDRIDLFVKEAITLNTGLYGK